MLRTTRVLGAMALALPLALAAGGPVMAQEEVLDALGEVLQDEDRNAGTRPEGEQHGRRGHHDDRGLQEQHAEHARDACRHQARHDDYQDIDIGEVHARDGEGIVVEMRARREGHDHRIRCVYDADTQQASLEVEGG